MNVDVRTSWVVSGRGLTLHDLGMLKSCEDEQGRRNIMQRTESRSMLPQPRDLEATLRGFEDVENREATQLAQSYLDIVR